VFDLWGSKALDRHQRRAKGRQYSQFTLVPRGGLPERLQDLDTLGKMGHRLLIRTPLHGILPGVAEILDGPVGVVPLHKMLG